MRIHDYKDISPQQPDPTGEQVILIQAGELIREIYSDAPLGAN
jgi:hypothetical protein